ncbi:unnamed protein product [Allacma fusca]|uniref:Uncharacterized protein n=1 Tax=Allacma fusca TaxID=39272 RepID=A0A8J2K9D2_9HEXA|nr:unnamed protein product [Allacma fusca]
MQEQQINLVDLGNARSFELDFTSVLGNLEPSARKSHAGSLNSDIPVKDKKQSSPEGDTLPATSSTKRKRKRKPITQEKKLKEIERLRNYRKRTKEEKEKLLSMVKELQAKLSEPNETGPEERTKC